MTDKVFTSVTEAVLRPDELAMLVAASGHGAEAMFVGVVRDHHEGRDVRAVTYDAFRPLAARTLRQICEEAAQKWPASVACSHRIGRLEVGEASVAIAAGSAHRAEAFEACRYVIEEIKKRLPVWKKEHYVGGDSAWTAGCALEARR